MKSPETDEEEREQQKKYLSATRNARRLLLRRDIENNSTNIDPDDIDSNETDWKMKSLLTEEERDMLQPKAPALIKVTTQLHSAVDKMAKKKKKKFLTIEEIFNSMSDEQRAKRKEDRQKKVNINRQLDYTLDNKRNEDFPTPSAKSTPKNADKKRPREKINATLDMFYKTTKSPHIQNGKGQAKILRWDQWIGL